MSEDGMAGWGGGGSSGIPSEGTGPHAWHSAPEPTAFPSRSPALGIALRRPRGFSHQPRVSAFLPDSW